MARIAGIDLPKNKRIEIGLTYLFGVGLNTSKEILEATKIDANKLVLEKPSKVTSRIKQTFFIIY